MKGFRPVIAAVAIAASVGVGAAAQAPQVPPELRNAQALMQQQKWAAAAAAYEAMLASSKTDPRPHAGLAAALYSLGEFQKARPHALEATRLLQDPKMQFEYPGLQVGAVHVRIARIENRLGHTDAAFERLMQAANYPLASVRSVLDSEPDMENLRKDPRWQVFTDTIKANADPCNALPEYRQFDFWIGEWDVQSAAGQTVGTSRIERILNSCVIQETYTAAPGTSAQASYVGQAYHFYDQNLKKWVQHYVDTTGTPFDWTGEFRDGAMRYLRAGPFGPSNAPINQRMTFTKLPDGKVQQLFEQSMDGVNWRPGFNGIYVRRPGGTGAAGSRTD